MAAAATWCAAANERGAPSDVTVTFSSSRRFRQAALGFRFRSGQREREERDCYYFCILCFSFSFIFTEVFFALNHKISHETEAEKPKNFSRVENNQQVPLLPSPGGPGGLHVLEM